MIFRRKFSINPYRTLRLPLAGMSFYKDWLNTSRGDPCPVTFAGETRPSERTGDGYYTARGKGLVCRLIGQHFPYATYGIEPGELSLGRVGLRIAASCGGRSSYTPETAPVLDIFIEAGAKYRVGYELSAGGETAESKYYRVEGKPLPGTKLSVTFRGGAFDIYLDDGVRAIPVITAEPPGLGDSMKHGTFSRMTASLLCELHAGGRLRVDSVGAYLCGGISHADIKPICYEDGAPMLEDGRLYLTVSARFEAKTSQIVVSLNPSGCDLRLEGAIFFDCGDDRWCHDVGSSVLFNRMTGEWYVWSVAFSHGHILCHGTSKADLRHGIHVIDAKLMPIAEGQPEPVYGSSGITLPDDRMWLGKSGDEDPHLIYDAEREMWYLTVCRLVRLENKNAYRYFMFESERPFDGFRYVTHTLEGENTGGSMICVAGKRYFVCGSDFGARAHYNIYRLGDFSEYRRAEFDFDDGGFRGWGTIIPIPCGNRTRLLWLTFDRHGGSEYNWSYGNLYGFEGEAMIKNGEDIDLWI